MNAFKHLYKTRIIECYIQNSDFFYINQKVNGTFCIGGKGP